MTTTARKLRIVWDGPFRLVNARRSLHWTERHREDATLRQWAAMAGGDDGTVFRCPVRIEALMTQASGVLPDCDAIAGAVKPVIDGLCDAGVIADDTPEHVRSITYHAPERTDARTLIVMVTPA